MRIVALFLCASGWGAHAAAAGDGIPPGIRLEPARLLVADATQETQPSPEESETSEQDAVSLSPAAAGYDLSGPYFLRSADPEETGELEFKLRYGYETTAHGGENVLTPIIEWGMAEDHSFIFRTPLELGEGAAEGNGDIEIEFHDRLWKEEGWLPAFAVRNALRIPSGCQSSGVAWTSRGLITKSIIPDRLRLHVNPWLKLHCRDEEDVRTFQWGTAIGADYRLSEKLILVADYQYRNGELEGTRDNHELEFGCDWEIARHHHIGLATKFSLDGDDYGPHWGIAFSYWYEFDFVALDR